MSKARTSSPRPEIDTPSPGVIDAAAVYTVPEFLARTGMSPAAFRLAWKPRGIDRDGNRYEKPQLRVLKAHKRKFVSGRDWMAYLEELAEAAADGREDDAD